MPKGAWRSGRRTRISLRTRELRRARDIYRLVNPYLQHGRLVNVASGSLFFNARGTTAHRCALGAGPWRVAPRWTATLGRATNAGRSDNCRNVTTIRRDRGPLRHCRPRIDHPRCRTQPACRPSPSLALPGPTACARRSAQGAALFRRSRDLPELLDPGHLHAGQFPSCGGELAVHELRRTGDGGRTCLVSCFAY